MQIPITDVPEDMIRIGKQLVLEKREEYTPEAVRSLQEQLTMFAGGTQPEDLLYRYVYDYWVYGVDASEEFTFDFLHKTHREKSAYLTWNNRFTYLNFLNNPQDIHVLDNKFEAYEKLRPYYKREAILVTGEEDYDTFVRFVKKHGEVIVKPVNLYLTIGIRWLNADEIGDYRALFDELMASARAFAEMDSRCIDRPQLIVEELIREDAALASAFNPRFLSPVRVTTVLVNGRVEVFYPCFRTLGAVTYNGNDIDYQQTTACFALVDPETGVISSDGRDYFGCIHAVHPLSGHPFKGTRLPAWGELKDMLTEAALSLPSIRYIGWDVACSDRGWCIIEGNSNGEFFAQMVSGRGYKKEFERLIGWRMPDKLWWQPWFGRRD